MLLEIRGKQNFTIIVIDHDIDLIMNISDRVQALDEGGSSSSGTRMASSRCTSFRRISERLMLVEVEDLVIGYGKTPFSRARLDLEEGGSLAVLGANGAGKSTLMMSSRGLLRPWRDRSDSGART